MFFLLSRKRHILCRIFYKESLKMDSDGLAILRFSFCQAWSIFSPNIQPLTKQHQAAALKHQGVLPKAKLLAQVPAHPREAVLLSRSKNAGGKNLQRVCFPLSEWTESMVGAKVGLPQLSSWNLRLNLLRCLSSAGLDFGYGYLVHLGCANHRCGSKLGC